MTPTLDGPVLAVLAAAGRPLTVGDVAAQSARGSEIGIRRSLARLVDQGIVRATLVGNRVHERNRDHLAASVADVLAGLRVELWRRLRAELSGWDVPPAYACAFGSAARAEGDETSDIDVVLVHPPLPGESKPRSTDSGVAEVLGALAANGVAEPGKPADPARWHAQVDRLRERVQHWTGNSLQVIDLSLNGWSVPDVRHQALLAEIQRDCIELARFHQLPGLRRVDGTGGKVQ